MIDRKHIIHLLDKSLLDYKILYEKYVKEKGVIPYDIFCNLMRDYARQVGLFSVYSSFAEINVLRDKEGVIVKYL